MADPQLIYLPLGGAGEIGMNAYVYGYGPEEQERLILVDIGVAFSDMSTSPGVNLIFADIAWLEERRDRLEAIFITHGHEDHIGGVGRLAAQFGVPIYARPFTAELARQKITEAGHDPALVRVLQPWPDTTQAGPFTVGFAPISHSIPESSALVIDTPQGRVVHSGDFKIDTTPVLGEPFDAEMWQDIAKDGIQAFVCDSTNVFVDRPGRSEATLAQPLTELIASRQSGWVVATTFASNVARLKTLADAAMAAGRSVCLLGRAMRRMVEAAKKTGILDDFPSVISLEDAAQMPRESVMLLVTGSQGEPRAASAQLARGSYRGLRLQEGDLFLYSSKTIPGNEREVIRTINQLSELGVDVIDDRVDLYHVSGHANRPDLIRMHELLKPKMVVPCHGEHRHLREHAQLVSGLGHASVVAPNGNMIALGGDVPRRLAQVETGRRYLDGSQMIGANDGVVRDRLRIARNGLVLVSVLFEPSGELAGDPWVELVGLGGDTPRGEDVLEILEAELATTMERAAREAVLDENVVEELLRRRVRGLCADLIGRKPEVVAMIGRLE